MAKKTKKPRFAFDYERLEDFARQKSGVGSPACFERFGANAILYYSNKRRDPRSIPMRKSIITLVEEMGLTLDQFRSLFIEEK